MAAASLLDAGVSEKKGKKYYELEVRVSPSLCQRAPEHALLGVPRHGPAGRRHSQRSATRLPPVILQTNP